MDTIWYYPDPAVVGANPPHSVGHTGAWTEQAEHGTWSCRFDAMYTAAKAKATDDALDQINSLDASYVSTQSILQREIAQNYTTAAQSYNTMASGFPANVIGTLWGAGQVELYAAQ